mmetsp:Transcript_7802/g.6973  ORF Transcript_7802/g.6973 Transcript_7802/m.6973 type:complete len:102 (+) Transcript_7802:37-342(+)
MEGLRNSPSGSTIVETISPTKNTSENNKVLLLKLKQKKKNIQWSNNVIDNEFMNKKTSKKCCIYHKRKQFGESDSDESDSDTEKAKAQPKNKLKNLQRFHA